MITSDVGFSIPNAGHVTKVKKKRRFLPEDLYHIFIEEINQLSVLCICAQEESQ